VSLFAEQEKPLDYESHEFNKLQKTTGFEGIIAVIKMCV